MTNFVTITTIAKYSHLQCETQTIYARMWRTLKPTNLIFVSANEMRIAKNIENRTTTTMTTTKKKRKKNIDEDEGKTED